MQQQQFIRPFFDTVPIPNFYNDIFYKIDVSSNGLPGPIGYTGSTGFTGSVGSTGFTGSQGEIGFTGFTGSQGEIGFTGSTGFTGSQGEIGFTGSQGEIGFTGSAAAGPVGFTGSIGPQGLAGTDPPTKCISSNYTTKVEDFYIGVNSHGPVTVTLTNPATDGLELVVKAEMGAPLGTRKVTVTTSDSSKIDGASSYVITVPYGSVNVIRRGGEWHII